MTDRRHAVVERVELGRIALVILGIDHQQGRLDLAEISIRRIIQLRPDIGSGREAIGTSASMKSGWATPQTQVNIPPS